ncbi:uncharacterized, partial [Tachysurus ichikawai]
MGDSQDIGDTIATAGLAGHF